MLLASSAIILLAFLPIYTGAYSSLRRPSTAPQAAEGDDPEEDALMESLGMSDALLFPVLGASVLGGLYLLITYVSKDWVNTLFNVYFVCIGVVANTQTLATLLQWSCPENVQLQATYHLQAGTKEGISRSFLDFHVTVAYVVSAVFAVVLSVLYGLYKNWVASNIFGLSFAYNGVQLMALDSFKTGMILLSGLFLYDIYFVFGTKIMLTVATSIEAPIKIVFPRNLMLDPFGPATMLGLGDIVIPGVYVALALRYDLSAHHKRYPNATYWKGWTGFEKPYFIAAATSYVLGLLLTTAVMHIFKAAQPALLYLSPACILSTVVTAWLRGELKEVWQYVEEHHEIFPADTSNVKLKLQ